jgi:hypothetical protein
MPARCAGGLLVGLLGNGPRGRFSTQNAVPMERKLSVRIGYDADNRVFVVGMKGITGIDRRTDRPIEATCVRSGK